MHGVQTIKLARYPVFVCGISCTLSVIIVSLLRCIQSFDIENGARHLKVTSEWSVRGLKPSKHLTDRQESLFGNSAIGGHLQRLKVVVHSVKTTWQTRELLNGERHCSFLK